MTTAAPEPKANMGQPIPRYDAVAKVTGSAEYAADVPLARPAYAYLITSAIAKGRIDAIETEDAKKIRGVVAIVTHENAEKLKDAKLFNDGGHASTTNQPLKSADIAEEGQIIGIVLAETYEAAREAANRVRVSYTAIKPATTLDSPGTTSAPAKGQVSRHKDDPKVGNFEKGFLNPRFSSRRPTRRRPSITIRWSCLRPAACGTVTASPSTNPASMCMV